LKTAAAAASAAAIPISFEDTPPVVEAVAKPPDKLVHVRTLVLDRPTKNMNIYPRKAIEEMVDRIPKEGVWGQIGMPKDCKIRLSEISHVATKFEFLHDCDTHEDWVICDIQCLDTPEGRRLRELVLPKRGMPKDIVFRTAVQADTERELFDVTPCQEERYVTVVSKNVKLLGVHAISKVQDGC